MSKTMTGVAVTVHSEPHRFGLPCIRAVRTFTPRPYLLSVIDNACASPSAGMFLHMVDFWDSKKANVGLTQTWNEHIQKLIDAKCGVIVLLNDDTLVDASFRGLVEHAITYPDYAWGPVSNAPGHGEAVGQRACLSEGFHLTPYINGFCMAISTELLIANKYDENLFFDPSKPFAGNEDEWCARHRAKGGKCAVLHEAYVFHHKLATWTASGSPTAV